MGIEMALACAYAVIALLVISASVALMGKEMNISLFGTCLTIGVFWPLFAGLAFVFWNDIVA